MKALEPGLVIWDIDGTLIPADLRWLRRAIARTYGLGETSVRFPEKKVHGYTDESIVIDAAIASGVSPADVEAQIGYFASNLEAVMDEGRLELRAIQPPYPGAIASTTEMHQAGFVQTVLTGNLRPAAEVKLSELGLNAHLDLRIGGYGSDDRDRFQLPDVVKRRFGHFYNRELDPQKTVVIGDAPNDIACARHAGFHVIVVTHRATRAELEQHAPDVILESLDPSKVIPAVKEVIIG
ncbi:HAD family hydrolase [Actinoplanes sp. NPDC020271]|uniref:HAD family hydrolase n=1 Tax=Actinoplanes sp. NPDC020271 TaxID=3363896 RepID=UPI0037AFF9E8